MAPKAGHIDEACFDTLRRPFAKRLGQNDAEPYQSAEGTAKPPALTTVGTSSFSESDSASR